MSSELLITIGVLSCLTGTLFGGVIALIGRDSFIQRLSQTIILIALALGTAAAGVFLVKNLSSVTLIASDFFFPGKLVLDHLSAIFFFLINGVGLLAMLYGLRYLLNEKHLYNVGYVQFLSALFLLGMQTVVLATSPVFFIFAWELMSFSSFLLVMSDFRTESIRPALFYLIMTHLGAGALMAAFFLISGGIVGIDFAGLSVMAASLPAPTLILAFALFFFGFGSKAGLFPFHGWLPEAHPQAPSHISALMSGVMLKIAVYGMLRVLLFILPPLPAETGYVVIAIGLFSAIFGVLYSVIETDIKRILAFSSIENLGLIFSMIGVFLVARSFQMDLLAQASLVAVAFQSIGHAFFKSGLFLTAGVAGQAFHTRNIEKMGGMAKHMKLFSLAVLLLVLAASALPPSGAFIGEWFIIQSIILSVAGAAFAVKVALLITLVVFGGVAGMAVLSMVRFFGLAFLAEPRTPNAHVHADPVAEMLFPIGLLGVAAFLLGTVAQPLMSVVAKGLAISPDSSFNPFISSFNPALLIVLLAFVVIVGFVLRFISSNKEERSYHTWDCGQPIDASMEYTATAFSAPIRFFFKPLLHASKQVKSEPLVATNPWLTKKSMTVETKPIWEQYFYAPLVNLVTILSAQIRKVQNGNIQFYITLILISLIITAIVSL